MANELISIPAGSIESLILLIRGQKVILDRTLARLYRVSTRVLKEAVNRNPTRFPPNFVFQLTTDESTAVNSNSRPYAFTEHGVLMLSIVLNSERAVQVNIEIIRTFIRLRETSASNAEITKRLDALEHDCKAVLEVIRKPMRLAIPRRREIGFRANTVKR